MPLATAFTPGTGVGLTDGGMVLGGLALSMIFLLAAFVCFDCIRDLNQSDAELEKQKERQKRGVVQMKSFRGWALLGIVICCLVLKHVHHISTTPLMSEAYFWASSSFSLRAAILSSPPPAPPRPEWPSAESAEPEPWPV